VLSQVALFEADSIGRSFGARRILTAASLQIRAGSITVLLGRNGCGKSTLLRVMLGFLRADWGTVRWHGIIQARPRLHRLAGQGLFFVPERDLLARNRNVAAHFAIVERVFGVAAAPTIVELDLDPLLHRMPMQLSAGERRRVELGLAQTRAPRCLIADELFLGLAPRDAERAAALVRRFADNGCAVLLTGHEVEWLLPLADDIVWMVAGTTHALGSPAQAARHDQFRREYLGPGSARARAHALQERSGTRIIPES
jgi:ABC-type multidrug transport system ATPase subunit